MVNRKSFGNLAHFKWNDIAQIHAMNTFAPCTRQ